LDRKINKAMATYTIEVNEKSNLGKSIVSLLFSTDDVKVMKVPNKTTLKAFDELRTGKGKKIHNVKEFLNGI
jgi:hypothetical protein